MIDFSASYYISTTKYKLFSFFGNQIYFPSENSHLGTKYSNIEPFEKGINTTVKEFEHELMKKGNYI